MAEEHTCAHEACTCAVEGEARFCSTECESAGKAGANGDDCTCGHADCV